VSCQVLLHLLVSRLVGFACGATAAEAGIAKAGIQSLFHKPRQAHELCDARQGASQAACCCQHNCTEEKQLLLHKPQLRIYNCQQKVNIFMLQQCIQIASMKLQQTLQLSQKQTAHQHCRSTTHPAS
jgi:hypothetical protein